MRCPYCGKDPQFRSYVEGYVYTYDKSATARTECCKRLVRVHPVRNMRVTEYTGTATEDDWGKEAAK